MGTDPFFIFTRGFLLRSLFCSQFSFTELRLYKSDLFCYVLPPHIPRKSLSLMCATNKYHLKITEEQDASELNRVSSETTEHVAVIKPSMSLSYPVNSCLSALSVSHKSQSCHSADEDKVEGRVAPTAVPVPTQRRSYQCVLFLRGYCSFLLPA